MRMNQNERRFDFHGLGAALKRAREEKGWTQAYVAELVDRDSRTIMNIENKGQYPSFDLFVKLITMFDVSVDQFIHADGGARSSSCRKHIDVLLNSMNEKELVVIEATAEGIKKARETEVPEYISEDNTLNVHISNLRNKMKAICPDKEFIDTVWGIGYRLHKAEG